MNNLKECAKFAHSFFYKNVALTIYQFYNKNNYAIFF